MTYATDKDLQLQILRLLEAGEWPLGELLAAAVTDVGGCYCPWQMRSGDWWDELMSLYQNKRLVISGDKHPLTAKRSDIVIITRAGFERLTMPDVTQEDAP